MVNFIGHPLKAQDLQRRSQVECCIATFSPAVINVNGYQEYYENDRPSLKGSGSPKLNIATQH